MTAKRKKTQSPVPIRRKQTIPGLVTLSNGSQYFFTVQHNICLAFVSPEDVSAILSVKRSCCGNGGSLFKEASDDEVRVFNDGGRI